jgi:hypothetical protein
MLVNGLDDTLLPEIGTLDGGVATGSLVVPVPWTCYVDAVAMVVRSRFTRFPENKGPHSMLAVDGGSPRGPS